MHAFRWAILTVLVTSGCQSYAPAPVDLTNHARLFAERMPDASALRAFAEQTRDRDREAPAFDLDDGIDLEEARFLALLLNPALRTVRSQADVARASAELAGLWQDPQISGSFFYVLDKMTRYHWFAGGYLAQTLPITGLPGLEKKLAGTQHELALIEARRSEAAVLNRLEAAWVRSSARQVEVDLLAGLVQRLSELEKVAAALAAGGVLMQPEARIFTLARVRYEAELISARGDARQSNLQLRSLMGLPPDSSVSFVPRLSLVDRVPADDRRERLLAGPLVELAQHQHAVAERRLELEVRKQWPELWVQPGWQEEDAQPRPAFGFSLPIPLWNANAREIAAARAARATAAEAVKEQVEVAIHDLARAEAAHEAAAAKRLILDSTLVPLVEQQLADVKRLAELGQLDVLLILDAVTRAYDAQLAAVTTAVAEADATVAINSLFWPSLTTAAKEE